MTPTQTYIAIINSLMQRMFNADWRDYATERQIAQHESEGWDAEKFVEFLRQKFNLGPDAVDA